MNRFKFQKDKSFEQRIQESSSMLNRYPDRIPCIVEKNERSTIKNINKHKYLVPNDITFGQFAYVIRKRIQLNPTTGFFLFVYDEQGNASIPNSSALCSQIYNNYRAKDLFLYITYSGENTFGSCQI